MTSSTSPRTARRAARPVRVLARTALVAGTATVLVPALATLAGADEPAPTCQTVTADALGRDAGPVRVALGDPGRTVVRTQDRVTVEGGPVRSITPAYADGPGHRFSAAAGGTVLAELAFGSYTSVEVCWDAPAAPEPTVDVPGRVVQVPVQVVTPPPAVTEPEPEPPVVDPPSVTPVEQTVATPAVRVGSDGVVPTDPTADPTTGPTTDPTTGSTTNPTTDLTSAPTTDAPVTRGGAGAPATGAAPVVTSQAAPVTVAAAPQRAADDGDRLAVTGATARPVVLLATVLAGAGAALVALASAARRRARR
jgi:hypothetical protein